MDDAYKFGQKPTERRAAELIQEYIPKAETLMSGHSSLGMKYGQIM